MITKNNKIIEFRGFNNIFIGLLDDDNKYFLFISKYNNAVINIEEDTLSAFNKYHQELVKFIKSYDCKLEVNLNGFNQNTLFNIFSLQNKQEYYTIVKVLETIYGR